MRYAVSTNLRDTLLRNSVTVYYRQQVTSRFQLTSNRSAGELFTAGSRGGAGSGVGGGSGGGVVFRKTDGLVVNQ